MKFLKKQALLILMLTAFLPLLTVGQKNAEGKPKLPAIFPVKPDAPSLKYIWIDGYWDWNKKEQSYEWRNGMWLKQKKGRKYVKGHWAQTKEGYIWIEGHWVKILKKENAVVDSN